MISVNIIRAVVSDMNNCFKDNEGSLRENSVKGCLAILDFNDVKVLAPSWADEFITGIKKEYKNTLQ